MANHHPRIAKLAKELAYRKGEVQTLNTREKALIAELAETRAQKQVAEKAVLELSRKIQDFHLNSDDVRTIRATPRLDSARSEQVEGCLSFILSGAHIGYLPRHIAAPWQARSLLKALGPKSWPSRCNFTWPSTVAGRPARRSWRYWQTCRRPSPARLETIRTASRQR